ncbi:MAG: prolipoprotein diacylglyceryl transferase [Elusimicrobia bacterium]|jgi:phosphatidylglycerol:prolipoprotein diacylglycerol transferase|nr:prolipoprotein diacylglyceryl transferase [Elusimicrobiota bacterium]
MYPVLFHWGPFSLHTYGLFAAFGFLAGYGIASAMARRREISPAVVGDALFPLLLGGLLGARLFYVLFHGAEFSGQWLDTLKIWQGGLMWQGGFLGALVAFALFLRRRRLPFLPMTDIFAPAVAVGQALGRIGCLFAGCCFGRTCDLPWAITFHHAESLAPTGQPLHPTQLYDAGLNLLLAAFLLILSKSPWSSRAGRLTGVYLLLAGAARLGVEYFRADARGTGLGIFSATGLVAIGLTIAGSLLLISLRTRQKS